MTRTFTVAQARAVLEQAQPRAMAYVEARADLAELRVAVETGNPSRLGGLAELKGLEAGLHETLSWFDAQGIQVKGIAPLLLDFPAELHGEDVLLCWLEGEAELEWYHRLDLGFFGRRRLPTT